MIDIRTEQLLPVRDVPAYLESRGLGKRVAQKSVQRWIHRGSDGAKLEAIRIGGMLVTSREALQRWVEAQSRSLAATEVPHAARQDPRPTHPISTRTHEETARILTDHRLMPTELDSCLEGLKGLQGSSRDHVAGVLFRAGFRTCSDVRKLGREGLRQLAGIGPRSVPVVELLWTALGERGAEASRT